MEDVAFLPVPLRTSLVSRLSEAWLADVQALRYTRGDGSVYHSVSALVMCESSGIALLASRQHGAATWQAEQLSYSFVSLRTALD
ncbi:hypothetical protein BJF80_06985 [Serinicoccus sp. CUA-874]|uniref:hypothetical protein n=1 Tax=Serinicoccus sp. CUA-874 TaxID=1517939 RepID=UPI000958FE96|nr:hypothetical protein [Serinicoccus sp. CUA-874]OLT16319.1 hypothetical protein BJF80_06985 [Serinicoccus sp. CUA-874]